MSTSATRVPTGNTRKHACFIAFVVLSGLIFYNTVIALVKYSLQDESSSHIILIPLIAFFLLYIERQNVFSITRASIAAGAGLALGGVILHWLAGRSPFPQFGNWPLSLETFSLVLVWIGGFIVCYGFGAFRAAMFPLVFLLLMVPLPEAILDRIIRALQEGST